MIKAIIWDMDGVLINSEHIHAHIESKSLKHFGINIARSEITRRYSGVKIEDEFADVIKKTGKRISVEDILKVRNQYIESEFVEKVKAVAFAKTVLKKLSESYTQALATSTEEKFAKPVLERNGLWLLLNQKVFGNQVSHSKPEPEIFLKAALLLKVTPDATVVIEDSQSGFKAAKAANMILIARKADHNQDIDFSLADYVITDLREIPEIIERINHEK